MVGLGSRRMLTFGGFSTDDEEFAHATPVAGTFLPHGKGMPLAVAAVEPKFSPVEGGVALTITGIGFRATSRYKVRFAVPHPPPPPPPASAAKDPAHLAASPLPMLLAERESFATAPAVFVDSRTVTCVVPDMSSMLCDGHVLVELCAADGGNEELWTGDQVELELTSTVDTSKLRLRGATAGVVGHRIGMTLHTFDHKNRRRSTGGDLFVSGLRNPGPPRRRAPRLRC